jgi:hypothetical protein
MRVDPPDFGPSVLDNRGDVAALSTVVGTGERIVFTRQNGPDSEDQIPELSR